MTEETAVPEVQQEDVNNDNTNDYKALYEESLKKLDTLAKHKDKLYQETKQAKADRDSIREKTLKEVESEQTELKGRLDKLLSDNRNERIQSAALKLSSELAEGDNVELLSEFIQKSLVNVADEDGRLSQNDLENIRRQYKENNKYRALLKSSKAVGGGAPGNRTPSGETQSMSRESFEKLDYVQRGKFMKSGGKLTD